MVADLQSSLLAGTSPKCCSVPRCSNPTATARPIKMHPATKTNSKFDDPGPISVSAPVVLLQMHRPSNLMVALITRDRPRSQYANTDVSLRINSFQGGNRVGQHGHTHTHFAPAPSHHTLARHAPYTQTPRNEFRTVRPGRRRASEDEHRTVRKHVTRRGPSCNQN